MVAFVFFIIFLLLVLLGGKLCRNPPTKATVIALFPLGARWVRRETCAKALGLERPPGKE